MSQNKHKGLLWGLPSSLVVLCAVLWALVGSREPRPEQVSRGVEDSKEAGPLAHAGQSSSSLRAAVEQAVELEHGAVANEGEAHPVPPTPDLPLKVSVVDELDIPLEGASVWMVGSEDHPGAQGVTDALGVCVLQRPDLGDRHTIRAEAPERLPRFWTIPKWYSELKLTLPSHAEVHGVVQDATTGSPITGAVVSAAFYGIGHPEDESNPRLVTDSAGRFGPLRVLNRQTFILNVSAEGYVRTRQRAKVDGDLSSTLPPILLEPSAPVTFYVHDATTLLPIPGAELSAWVHSAKEFVVTGEQGLATLRHFLPASEGRASATVKAPGYCTVLASVTTHDASLTKPVSIPLYLACSVVLRTVDRDGEAVAGVKVRGDWFRDDHSLGMHGNTLPAADRTLLPGWPAYLRWDPLMHHWQGRSDEEGFFTFQGILPGLEDFEVTLRQPGKPSTSVPVTGFTEPGLVLSVDAVVD